MAPKLLLAVLFLAVAATTALSLPGFGATMQFLSPDNVQNEAEEAQERKCNGSGTLGDCINPAEEFMVDSETGRRSLAWNNHRYISYAAMRKNSIPCSRRGSSYYNCGRTQSVNPYRRGCSAITMCARVW